MVAGRDRSPRVVILGGGGLVGGSKSRKGIVEGGVKGVGHCTAIRRVKGELNKISKGSRERTLFRVARAVAGGICEAREGEGFAQSEPFGSSGL